MVCSSALVVCPLAYFVFSCLCLRPVWWTSKLPALAPLPNYMCNPEMEAAMCASPNTWPPFVCVSQHHWRHCSFAILHPALVLEIAVAQARQQTYRKKTMHFFGSKQTQRGTHVLRRVATATRPRHLDQAGHNNTHTEGETPRRRTNIQVIFNYPYMVYKNK